jgi:hypothetical protein
MAVLHALLAALFMGAISTFGDFAWARWVPGHRAVYGLLHGAVICLCLGLAIAAHAVARRTPAPRAVAGAAAGLVIGIVCAGGFYLLAPAVGWSAMFLMWMLFWILFAVVQRWLVAGGSRAEAILRGLVAAVLSGAAFYAISGIWLRPAPGGPNYAWNFLCWTFAFLPGFIALFVGRRG